MWQECHTSAFFNLSKHSKECSIKQTTADTRLCMHTDKSLSQTQHDCSSFQRRRCIGRSSMNHITGENKMIWGQVWPYCTWEAAPLGWMWLVSCPSLLTPLWVRPFIWGDSREVWKWSYEALWWHVEKHCSRRLNEHDHPLRIMTAAHTLMLWTAPWVTWGLREGNST